MIQSIHQQYQQVQTLLRVIQQQNLAEQPDRLTFEASLLSLQQLFQQSLAAELVDASLAAKVQPLQIEINKQLRLLETDALFLKAARQPTTIEQRGQQIQSRVALLLNYCEAVLAIGAAP